MYGEGIVELEKMPLNTFWSKIVWDDVECIGLFLPLCYALNNNTRNADTSIALNGCMSEGYSCNPFMRAYTHVRPLLLLTGTGQGRQKLVTGTMQPVWPDQGPYIYL